MHDGARGSEHPRPRRQVSPRQRQLDDELVASQASAIAQGVTAIIMGGKRYSPLSPQLLEQLLKEEIDRVGGSAQIKQ